MIIYKIQNKMNDKIYIGMTTRNIKQRISDHLCGKTHIGSSLRKYGLENFDIEVIDSTEDRETLCDLEKFWIFVFDSKSPNGYNHTDGGEELTSFSEEALIKMRKPKSEETINRMKAAWNRPEVIEKHKQPQSKEVRKNKKIYMNLPEVKEKMKKPRSEEGKQNMRKPRSSEAHKNMKAAHNRPEVREKHRKPKGPMTEQHKQNLRKPRTEEQIQYFIEVQNRPEVQEKLHQPRGPYSKQASKNNRFAKLKEEEVLSIYFDPSSCEELSKKFKVSIYCIDRIKKKESWKILLNGVQSNAILPPSCS